MKNFANKLTAILAAAVMTVSAAGMSVSADTETDTPKYTGWVSDENGWQYLSEGVPYTSDYYDESYSIDGVHYRFFSNGYCWGKYTGRSKTGKRYYQDGLPHTGWVGDGDLKQYCLNGYPVTGDFQIDDRIYSFDKNGIYTGKSVPAILTASCGESISADTEKIFITVKYNDGNDNIAYTVGEPVKMERWENGKWKRCGKPSQYAVDDIAYELGGLGDCSVNFTKVAFYPNRYMGGDMPEGYYRVIVPCSYGETKKDLYAVFRAVPPVEVKMSEDIYTAEADADIDIQTYITVNSEKLADKDIYLKIEKKTNFGWETAAKEFKLDKDASCDSVSADGTITADVGMLPETGYYRAAVTVGKKSYEAAFRVEVSEEK